jgi:hypothetical protein
MATITTPPNFSAEEDAQILRKACEGFGTDEKAVINILAHRNASQRKQIRIAYESLFQEDLIKRLESELKGDFEKAVYRWNMDPEERDAVLANVAIRKGNRDYHVIIEIACVLDPEELLAVKRAYQARYKHSLEEDVAVNTSGDMRKFLLGLVGNYRYRGSEIDARLAKTEADIIHEAVKDKKFNHDEVIRILTTRSKPQIAATVNKYKEDHATSLGKTLSADSNEFVEALRTAIHCTTDHLKYYEKLARNALKGRGTDEGALTRVIVTRAERDLKDIKDLYFKNNSVSLDHDVAKETSGDYKAFLLTLLGKDE